MAQMFPELLLFPTRKEGQRALRKAARGSLLSLRFWGLFVVFIAALTLLDRLCVEPLFRGFGIDSVLPFMYGAIAGTVGVLGTLWVSRKKIRRRLRCQLRQMGVPLCVKCGYDLRGQQELRCPECGTELDEVALDELRGVAGEIASRPSEAGEH